jgi:hypothetical protein
MFFLRKSPHRILDGLHPSETVKLDSVRPNPDMNGQPSPVSPNRRARLKIVVLILVGLIVLYFVCRYSLALSIQRRIDSIHQAGFPATCAELDKWYLQTPPGENAADIYSNAFVYYQWWTNKDAQFSAPADARHGKRPSPPRSKRDLLPVVGTAKLPPRTEPLAAETLKVIAEYLSDNAESLRLLREAGTIKSCRYPVDLSKGASMSLRHLNALRQAARLLELEAIRYTNEQQPQPAVDSVIASLGVARSLNQEPTIISYLVHVACQGITLDSLERILNRIPLTDTQLAKLAGAIEESENPQALTRGFIGDRCVGLDVFQDLRAGKIPLKELYIIWRENPPLWPRFLAPEYKVTGLLELDEKDYLDMYENSVKITQLPPPESIAASQAAIGKLEHLNRWRILSASLLPPLHKAVIKATQCTAKIRDAKTVLAIERYRLTNGKLPRQLSDLVPTFLPAVPNDPFDGKPLRYKTLPKGYVVYSVGDDREDNGGVDKDSKGVNYVPGTDITFTVER